MQLELQAIDWAQHSAAARLVSKLGTALVVASEDHLH